MLIGRETFFTTELLSASENNKITLPIKTDETKRSCCLEDENSMRERMGTAMPTKAIGPQNAVVTPVKTEETRIR